MSTRVRANSAQQTETDSSVDNLAEGASQTDLSNIQVSEGSLSLNTSRADAGALANTGKISGGVTITDSGAIEQAGKIAEVALANSADAVAVNRDLATLAIGNSTDTLKAGFEFADGQGDKLAKAYDSGLAQLSQVSAQGVKAQQDALDKVVTLVSEKNSEGQIQASRMVTVVAVVLVLGATVAAVAYAMKKG